LHKNKIGVISILPLSSRCFVLVFVGRKYNGPVVETASPPRRSCQGHFASNKKPHLSLLEGGFFLAHFVLSRKKEYNIIINILLIFKICLQKTSHQDQLLLVQ
jgi:hypothetical protein